MSKFFIWTGFFVGSTLGGFVPALWGGDMMSAAGILLSMLGGVLGVVGGWKLGQMLG